MGTPRARRSSRRGATLTVSTVPTKQARQQIAALRGKAKASFLFSGRGHTPPRMRGGRCPAVRRSPRPALGPRRPGRRPRRHPPVPPHIAVWRSVRAHGETKTERSRRALALPAAAVHALRGWLDCQAGERLAAGDDWQDTGLVFTSHHGAALDAGNVRKMFKRVCAEAGIGDGWTPRELWTSFVSLMSHQGVSIEEIARLVGHATTRTEIVYRRELRPVITTGAEIMDQLFTPT